MPSETGQLGLPPARGSLPAAFRAVGKRKNGRSAKKCPPPSANVKALPVLAAFDSRTTREKVSSGSGRFSWATEKAIRGRIWFYCFAGFACFTFAHYLTFAEKRPLPVKGSIESARIALGILTAHALRNAFQMSSPRGNFNAPPAAHLAAATHLRKGIVRRHDRAAPAFFSHSLLFFPLNIAGRRLKNLLDHGSINPIQSAFYQKGGLVIKRH